MTRDDFRNIELLVLDVDGVLTDGRIVLDDTGREMKSFHVRDGMGIKLWHISGRTTAIITARNSEVVTRRAAELGIGHVFQGCSDKKFVLSRLLEKLKLDVSRTAYIGDDLPDLAVMRTCGFPVAVADAAEEVKKAAKLVTSRPGGRGAVREATEYILHEAGEYSRLLEKYYSE